ncbi:MAG: outer membrane protein assembly factor BamE [Methylophilaceae bacterium]|nr:outer membrane protein assembly factor BamE [Methylophilaceae bacterium]
MAVSADQPLKVITWVAAGFGVFTLLLTIVFFAWWAMKDRFVFGRDAYDPVRWMAPPSPEKPCARGDMVLDIQQRLLKPGMSRAQVTMLLGRPAWEEPSQIEYELGVCLWAVHGLRLYFDPDDRLIHSAIIQH